MKKFLFKKLMAFCLIFAVVFSMIPVNTFAANNPTEISTKEQLAEIQKTAGDYILTADIDLDDDWTPLADSYNAVHLDGNGYTITLNGKPLFEKINSDSSVNNLILTGSVTSAGHIGSLANILNGTIRNCVSYANVEYTGVSGGWSPNAVGGLAGYINTAAASVQNSVYAGTLIPGQADLHGAIANFKDFATGKIENCIGVGDKVGMSEGFSSNTDIGLGSNTLVADINTFNENIDNYVSQLNDNHGINDLEWIVNNGKLSMKRTVSTPATPEEIQALNDAIAAAHNADTAKIYTADTWTAFSEALQAAETQANKENPSQTAVVNATNNLNAATGGLQERSLNAVNLSGEDVVSITAVSGLESIQAGKYYRLDADLEITQADWYFPGNMNAVLDGNGHTITISAKNTSVWSEIGSDAVIQNLGVLGSASSSNNFGAIAQVCSGLIVNCWSRADVTTTGQNNYLKHTGGLVGELKSGGAVINSYVAAGITGNGTNTENGSVGAIAGSTENNSLIKNCYKQNNIVHNFAGCGTAKVVDSAAKTRADFYSSEFIALLNEKKDENCKEWTLSAEGFPHLGAAQEYQPPVEQLVTFIDNEGNESQFGTNDGLQVSLQDVDASNKVGTFSMPGAARWQDTIVGNKDVLWVIENGDLRIYKEGSAEVVAISSEQDGSKELARFTVTVVEGSEAADFRLTVKGEDVGDVLTLQGSEQATLILQIKRTDDDSWHTIPVSRVKFQHGNQLHRVNGTFYAEEPGTFPVQATYQNKTVNFNIVSEFVPVTSIRPALSGTYNIHQRNPNAQPLGAFLNLTLSHGAGTVIVEPENASYRDRWTMTSSDDTIAEYVPSMLVAVLPKKTGSVTLTATMEAIGQQPKVQGESEITIVYDNPVQSVSISENEFSVKENEDISLPITFSGPKSQTGMRVTEPAMDWSFSGDGEVEVLRDGSPIIWEEVGGEKPCEANDKYKLVGVKAGTVTVTGVPQDKTNAVVPITFTVNVEPGAELPPADNDALTKNGIKAGQEYLTDNEPEQYVYGNEWEIFSLYRSGKSINPDKLNAYFDSVETTYKNNPDAAAMKPTTIARVVLALGSVGQNAADFRGLNFIDMLCNHKSMGDGSNEPMWTLLALDSRGYAEPAGALWTRDKLITELITKYQTPEGSFGLNDNITGGIDITAMSIQALAPYYESRADVKTAVDKALAYLQKEMSRECDFDGSVESAAQVLLAITSLGKNPVSPDNGFAINQSVNLLTNITRYQAEDGGYKHYINDRSAQVMSTVQALQAFESYRRWSAQENNIFNLTDVNYRSLLEQRMAEAERLNEADYTAESWRILISAKSAAEQLLAETSPTDDALKSAEEALSAAIAGLKPLNSGGNNNPGNNDKTITVSFRLVGDSKHNSAESHTKYVNWIRTCDVTIADGSTVYDVFAKVLKEKGMAFEERPVGYISGIKAPSALGSYWLKEFDNGSNSGWKYLVNGKYPNVSLRYYWPKNGDEIIWHYVDDYTDNFDNTTKWQEAEDIEPVGSSSNGNTTVDNPDGNGQPADSNGFIDTANHWAADAINFVVKQNLFTGTTATTFEPETAMNRAMLVTVLWRLDGQQVASAQAGFTDLASGAYYTDAVAWANANGIVKGYSETQFAPNNKVTREQMAAILHRYAEHKGYDVSNTTELNSFVDADKISPYAVDAVKWAKAAELMNGRTSTTLAPQGDSTRAEVATMIQRFVNNIMK